MKFSTIEAKVSELLTDADQTTWTQSQVQQWLAEAERQIVALRPDAYSIVESFDPVDGETRQSIPSDGLKILDVMRNLDASGNPGKAIQIVDKATMDDVNPNWHTDAAADTSCNYIYNDLVPKVFYLYPKPTSLTRVELHLSKVPATPDFGADPDISLDDTFEAAMIQYSYWRCLSRADDQSPDAQTAESAYGKFLQLLGIQEEAKNKASPRTRAQRA